MKTGAFVGANRLRGMRVCLIRPPTLTSASAVGQDADPPRGPVYIAGALRAAEHEVCRAVAELPPPNWTRSAVAAYIDNALTHGADLGRSMPIPASRD